MTKRFNVQDRNGETVMGPIAEDNVYLTAYGSTNPGCKEPTTLKVGEVTRRTYALSGQEPTTYWVVRLS